MSDGNVWGAGGGGLWSSLWYGIYTYISGIIYLLGFRGLNIKGFKKMGVSGHLLERGPIRGRVIWVMGMFEGRGGGLWSRLWYGIYTYIIRHNIPTFNNNNEGIRMFIGEGPIRGRVIWVMECLRNGGGGVFGVAYDMAYIPIYQA